MCWHIYKSIQELVHLHFHFKGSYMSVDSQFSIWVVLAVMWVGCQHCSSQSLRAHACKPCCLDGLLHLQILSREDMEPEKKGGKLHKLQKPLNHKLDLPQLIGFCIWCIQWHLLTSIIAYGIFLLVESHNTSSCFTQGHAKEQSLQSSARWSSWSLMWPRMTGLSHKLEADFHRYMSSPEYRSIPTSDF